MPFKRRPFCVFSIVPLLNCQPAVSDNAPAKRPPSDSPTFAPSAHVSHASACVPDGTINRSRTDPGSFPFNAFTASGWPSARTLNPSPSRMRPIPTSFPGRISTSRGTDVSYVAFHSSGNVAAATGRAPVNSVATTQSIVFFIFFSTTT